MKKNVFTFASLVILSLSSCGYKNPGEVKFTVSNLSTIEIHSSLQTEFLESEDPDNFIARYTDELVNYSKSAPEKTKVSYTISSDNGTEPKSVQVYVSEQSDMSNPMKFDGTTTEADIYNLKTNTKYYYQVVGHYVSDFASEVKEFSTSNATLRNNYVDGVENVRDLGGWNSSLGIYRQGLIYRTAQYNHGDARNNYNKYVSAPTELGKKTLLENLKIKTEIDLRETIDFDGIDENLKITSSPLGDSVNYVSCPMIYRGKNVLTQDANKESLKLFFNTLADSNNYPIAFHCLRGTDRTGALAYAIGALCGVSAEDLLKDYLFSNFARIESVVREGTIRNLYIKGINDSEGSTLQQKAKNYLLANIDIQESTLNSIINILVDQRS